MSRSATLMFKILQVNKFHYLRGGSERHVFELSEILEKKGHKVINFSMKNDLNNSSKYSKYFTENVNLDRLSFKSIVKIFHNYDAVRNLRNLIKEEKPEIAHLHNIAYQISPSIINELKQNNIPIVQTLHDYKLICPNAKLFNKNKVCFRCGKKTYYNSFLHKCVKDSYAKSFLASIEARFHHKTYNKVNLFIAPSIFMKDACVRFGIPAEKIKVLYNFIDFEKWENKYHKESAISEKYLLYFGRLSREKGIDILLRAFLKTEKNLRLKIAGSGEEFKNLKNEIENLGLDGKVDLLGKKNSEELSVLLSNAQAVIIPSLCLENMPYSLLEAMAMGKTVIASQVGGIKEILRDGENGFLFAQGNINELRNKISELENYNLEEMGAMARETIKNLNAENYYKAIIKVYETLI